ncbi:YciI family protein [Ornithinibacillus sp. FSL M8-0202]|uniref:YciI family protein n=1 Tax=unclassified Ornithinibacillus TaxID=2620869 RepID=UPI0030CF6E1A
MKLFAVFLPMKDEEKSKQYRQEHLQFLQEKQEDGFIFAKGRFVDGAGGLVIYKADLLEQVEDMVKKDPYVLKGARGYEIHEWEMTQA